MPTAGNIEAIRDWVNRYYYKKSDVNKYFIRLNEGLTAYALTLVGPANTTCTIVEQVQSNPQTYNVDLPSSGVYTGIFFFTQGSTITLTAGQYLETHTLSAYQDTIIFSNLFPIARITDYFSTASNDYRSTMDVTGCSGYDNLVVIISVSYRNGVNKATMEQNSYLTEGLGTEISQFGQYYNNQNVSYLHRVYVVPVTADTMTLTGKIWNYQVLGLRSNRAVATLTDLFQNDGVLRTSIPVGDCSNYLVIVPIVSRGYYNPKTQVNMESETYYHNSSYPTLAESGLYINSSSSSLLARSYAEVLSGDTSDVTLTDVMCTCYSVLGIA